MSTSLASFLVASFPPGTFADTTKAPTSGAYHRVLRGVLVTLRTVRYLGTGAAVVLGRRDRFKVIWSHAIPVFATRPDVVDAVTIWYRSHIQFVRNSMDVGLDAINLDDSVTSVVGAGPEPTTSCSPDLGPKAFLQCETRVRNFSGAAEPGVVLCAQPKGTDRGGAVIDYALVGGHDLTVAGR